MQIVSLVLSLVLMYFKNRDPKWRREFSESLKYVHDGIANRDGSIVTLEFDKLRREAQVDLRGESSRANQ